MEYTLTSCNGHTKTSSRRAIGLVVESLDGHTQHRLPTLIECDEIPNKRGEIPVPEVAHHYPHLYDIETAIPPMNNEAEILLLIGRDLIESHHVLAQRLGPSRTPCAQRLSLGWVIIGESCLETVHQPDGVVVNKTHVLRNSRPSLLVPCPNTFETQEYPPSTLTPVDNSIGRDIFDKTKDDDKVGLSIEDREFLTIINDDFVKGRTW